MADHQEMTIHAAAETRRSHSHGVDWWSTAVSCSPDQLPPGWSSPDNGNSSRSGNAASSVTLQESAGGIPGPAAVAGPQPVAGTFAAADWSQPYSLDGSGFHGFMMNTPSLTSPSSSNNNPMMPRDPHHQNHQFLSNLGLELLSSPTSPPPPSGGFRSSSLLRSLTEPVASAKPLSDFHQQAMNQQAPGSIRETSQFSNNTPFWNASPGFGAAEAATSLGTARQLMQQTRPTSSLEEKSVLEGAGDSSSIVTNFKKANTDRTPVKKARTGTPSPLPTFKVRKEKLGDRVTALQQLVSPFGKTDTASVLHETIEYIKFLHEQVSSLSAPYLKNRQQVPYLKISRDDSEATATKGDLTGRGLCLVPISSTFAVASETPVDFWTPFGPAFR